MRVLLLGVVGAVAGAEVLRGLGLEMKGWDCLGGAVFWEQCDTLCGQSTYHHGNIR